MEIAFLEAAIAEAEVGVKSGEGGPFGALVVRDGDIVGRGHNRVTASCDPTAHAEVVAIRDACRHLNDHSLSGCVLYASCQPCPMCMAASYWARLERVYYAATGAQAAAAGFDDEKIRSELCQPPAARSLPSVHVPHPRAEAPFAVWRALPDRIDY